MFVALNRMKIPSPVGAKYGESFYWGSLLPLTSSDISLLTELKTFDLSVATNISLLTELNGALAI